MFKTLKYNIILFIQTLHSQVEIIKKQQHKLFNRKYTFTTFHAVQVKCAFATAGIATK